MPFFCVDRRSLRAGHAEESAGRASSLAQVAGALVTLPLRMQREQVLMRLTSPFTRARTRWMFGRKRRELTL